MLSVASLSWRYAWSRPFSAQVPPCWLGVSGYSKSSAFEVSSQLKLQAIIVLEEHRPLHSYAVSVLSFDVSVYLIALTFDFALECTNVLVVRITGPRACSIVLAH